MEIEEKAKLAELQAKIQFLEQRQRAEKALKVLEEMVGTKAKMEAYNSHDEVNVKEGSIPLPMKEETLEFGRQPKDNGKCNQKEIVWKADQNSCSRLPRLSNRRDTDE